MQIRKMTIEDYDGVYQLWLSTPGMGLNTADDSKEGIEKYLNRNPETCFIAQEGSEIVGVIMSGHDGRRGFIYHAAVKASTRTQGIGSALVGKAMFALEAEGINKVALVVRSCNVLGSSFWEKRGFKIQEDVVYRSRNINQLSHINT